jgi:hypothetical protein
LVVLVLGLSGQCLVIWIRETTSDTLDDRTAISVRIVCLSGGIEEDDDDIITTGAVMGCPTASSLVEANILIADELTTVFSIAPTFSPK